MGKLSIIQKTVLATAIVSFFCNAEPWTIDSSDDWHVNKNRQSNIEIKDGMLAPTSNSATFSSVMKTYSNKRKASSLTINQSPIWQNWDQVDKFVPKNLKDAPVLLRKGENDYWLFGRYSYPKKYGKFTPETVTLDGFDVALQTTPDKNQFDAPGAKIKSLGGYHAWQSRDMVNWIHHGAVTDKRAKWVTSAEQVGGKTYLYYDFPNDQDPHLIIDSDLTDGKLGQDFGMAFKDPFDGSDSAIIRDLQGRFHLILENWSPIDASTHAWDSPLASHAVSDDGISGFKMLSPAVDYRTKPTGKFSEYPHPHWHRDDPTNYPGKIAQSENMSHRIKKGDRISFGQYEIHEPAQEAFGDWAAISIGGQYYLFGDYDPVDSHGRNGMKTAWFTSSSINEPFTFCGAMGQGHPDPDVIFAEGQFYIASQTQDFVSPGPWVDGVEVRVGVDTNQDNVIDQWTKWTSVKETYTGIEGFAKQVAKTPAQLNLANLPPAYGFQFQLRLSDTTKNNAKPILDKITMNFK